MRKYLLFLLVALLISSPSIIFAVGGSFAQLSNQVPGGSGGGSLNPLGGTNTLMEFVTNVLKVVIQIAIPIAALALVYAGWLFVTAKGKESDVTKAKQALLWSVIGLAVLLAARAIVETVRQTISNLG